MSSLYDVAEYVAALCRLSMGENFVFHDADGSIDRALEATYDHHPKNIQTHLNFSSTGVGRRCFEWPEISKRLIECGLAECPGPTFTHLKICLASDDAELIMYQQGWRASECRKVTSAFNLAMKERVV